MTSSVTGCSTCSRALTSRKKNVAVVIEQELGRAGADVAGGEGETQRGLAEARAQPGVDRRGRRLLDDLLVAPLERAVALAQVDAVAVRVEQQLHLDVARPRQVALQHQPVVAERRRAASRRAAARTSSNSLASRTRRACPCRHRLRSA